MARLKSIQASEHEEQASLIKWAFAMRRQIPELEMLFAIPNQGAARLKNLQTEGVMKGVPDLFLAVARPRHLRDFDYHGEHYHGLFIELKRRKGGKLSMEQIAWLSKLTAEGYLAEVAYGWEEARDKILRYLRGGADESEPDERSSSDRNRRGGERPVGSTE